MEPLINNIVQQLLHQPSLQSVATEELQRITTAHPSFATAHFLLLKKMQQDEHPGFQQQLQKTNLYFNNPLWLKYLLNNNTYIPAAAEETAAVLNTATAAEPALAIGAAPNHEAATTNAIAEEPVTETLPEPAAPEKTASSPALETLPEEEEQEPVAVTTTTPPETASNAPEAADTAALELELQPYHTIDYFAALGIKVGKLDENPQDNFGKQLKSFTEWLKAMKKGPKVALEKDLPQQDEKKIVTDAEQSVQQKEIITEAMAEVLEKQGLNEIAVKVYQKLSLQNPSKSAYFAAKIEELKTK